MNKKPLQEEVKDTMPMSEIVRASNLTMQGLQRREARRVEVELKGFYASWLFERLNISEQYR